MDIWHLIERDHANIAQLIHEGPMTLNGQGVIRSRERLLDELIAEFKAHTAGVEASLYGPLTHEPSTHQLIGELQGERSKVIRALADLAQYRRTGSEGWLDTFEDVTYLVDQHLHRYKHDLVPAAQQHLSADDVNDATRAFIRTKINIIRSRHRTGLGWPKSPNLALGLMLCATVLGLTLLAQRRGGFRTVKWEHNTIARG
jgi:nitrogenase molybdenum-iron protein alpha/beta subunit